jgi:Na+/proline symporter
LHIIAIPLYIFLFIFSIVLGKHFFSEEPDNEEEEKGFKFWGVFFVCFAVFLVPLTIAYVSQLGLVYTLCDAEREWINSVRDDEGNR